MEIKIAIVHDWLVVRGGAERVLERLLCLYPTADLYCLFGNKSAYIEPISPKRKFNTSFLDKIPFFYRFYRLCAIFMPFAVQSLKLDSYDLIITSSWAFAHGVKKNKNAKHLAYVHSPMRWAWDMEDEYLSRSKIPEFAIKHVKKQLGYLRKWDVIAAQKPDLIVANSSFIQKRILKNWGRKSIIIHPPVIVGGNFHRVVKHNCYISISRLVQNKRIDKIISAFKHLPDKELIIAGEGPERYKLEKNSSNNVSFVGFLSDEKKFNLLIGSKAMIQASNEDFGISLVEANACGIPAIAYSGGGASEIIQNVTDKNPTGLLFDDLDPKRIAHSINLFEKYKFERVNCKTQASKFSSNIFDAKIVGILKNLMDKID